MKASNYLKGWKGIALIIYMWLILTAYYIVYLDRRAINTDMNEYLISIAEAVLLALLCVCPKILSFAERVNIIPEEVSRRQKITFFFMSWLFSFAVLFTMYAAFYPGAFSPDSIDQYMQAMGFANYNDWHPVLHTLFSFTLPLKLSGGWVGSIVLFQIVIFSLSLAYMSSTLAEYGNRKYAALVVLYIMFNPATLSIVMFPWKDVAFAVFAMLSTAFAVRVYFTGGQWLNTRNIIMFSIVLVCTTIFRHNAILFTLPLLVAVMLCAKRRANILLLLCTCAGMLIVKGVLYPYLDTEKPGYRVRETTCAAITIIADAVCEAPDNVDGDIKDFLYSVAPKEKWDKYYRIGEFNSVKFRGINSKAIEEAGYGKIFDMTFRCLKQATFASVRGFLALTDMVWGIAEPVDWEVKPLVIANKYGIENRGIQILQDFYSQYSYICKLLFSHIFWHVGLLCLVVLVFVLAKLDFRKVNDRKRVMFALPLFVHNFGTMLFLGGNDFRFFYCTYLTVPLILLLIVRNIDK